MAVTANQNHSAPIPFELLNQPLFTLDVNRRVTFVTDTCRNLFARIDPCPIGRRFCACAKLYDFRAVQEQIDRAFDSQTTITFEDYVPTLREWFEYHITTSPGGVCVLVTVITVRKRAEISTQSELEREVMMFRGSGTATMRLGLDGRILAANPRCLDLTGLSEVDLFDRHFEDLFPPTEATEDSEMFAALISGRRAKWSVERLLRRRDGGDAWINLTVSLVSSSAAAPRFFIAVLNEIGDRKASEESLQFALEAAGLAQWDYDSTRNETRRGPGFDRIFGLGTPRAYWGFDDFLLSAHPEDRPEFISQFTNALANIAPLAFEHRIVWPDGTLRWILLRGRVYPDHHGRPLRMAGVVRDVTVEKETEHHLQNARILAEEANRAKSHFLANVSHEIRTPLGAIIGFSDVGQDLQTPAEERQRFFSIINRNGRALNKLIDDILDLSKVEAGYLEVEYLTFSPRELVREVVGLLGRRAEEKRVRLNVADHPDVPDAVESDPTRLRQIVLNVLNNSIKFTTDGEITVTLATDDGRLNIDVRDTGIGIAVNQRDRLFRPFGQADSSTTRQFGGTGLGLDLSRKLARAMGGDLTLEMSEPGVGSTFRVSVPTTRAQSTPASKPPTSTDGTDLAAGEQIHIHGMRVLVADDSEDNQDLIQILLSQRGVTSVMGRGWSRRGRSGKISTLRCHSDGYADADHGRVFRGTASSDATATRAPSWP